MPFIAFKSVSSDDDGMLQRWWFGLNLSSRQEVDDLHQQWSSSDAKIVSPPESKPWKLHEFTASGLDGNLLHVFYDFSWETK